MARNKKPIFEISKTMISKATGQPVQFEVPQKSPAVGGEVRREIPKPVVTKPVPRAIVKSTVKTKGGDYPVYGKTSGAGMLFRQAFADARRAGKKQFVWQGRKYTTEMA